MPIWLTTKAHIYNSEGIVSASFGFPLFCGTWSLITLVNGGPWTLCHLGVLSPLLQGTGRKGHLWGDVPVFSHQIFLEHPSLPLILCHPQRASGGIRTPLPTSLRLSKTPCTSPPPAAQSPGLLQPGPSPAIFHIQRQGSWGSTGSPNAHFWGIRRNGRQKGEWEL